MSRTFVCIGKITLERNKSSACSAEEKYIPIKMAIKKH